MSTSHDKLERIRSAYSVGAHASLKAACGDLLAWIREGGDLLTITEPQLTALAVMSLSYARARLAMASAEKE